MWWESNYRLRCQKETLCTKLLDSLCLKQLSAALKVFQVNTISPTYYISWLFHSQNKTNHTLNFKQRSQFSSSSELKTWKEFSRKIRIRGFSCELLWRFVPELRFVLFFHQTAVTLPAHRLVLVSTADHLDLRHKSSAFKKTNFNLIVQSSLYSLQYRVEGWATLSSHILDATDFIQFRDQKVIMLRGIKLNLLEIIQSFLNVRCDTRL